MALKLYDKTYQNRLILGTAQYPSLEILQQAITASQTELVTVSLRRQIKGGQDNHFWQMLQQMPCDVLPNTAGCYHAKEAITTAQMAREVFNTPYIKLEVIGNSYNLQPDPFELLEAARVLINEGFSVLPYCTDDVVLCERLLELGCQVLMPWAAPIGSGQGLLNPYQFRLLRARFPQVPLIVDAGLGEPKHATDAMAQGADGVMINTAVASAQQPVTMAKAFNYAVQAGFLGRKAGRMPQRDLAVPSTPMVGVPFWHQNDNTESKKVSKPVAKAFRQIDKKRLRFYPIVSDCDRLTELAKAGCQTAQIRIKTLSAEALKQELASAIAIARQYNLDLYVNDHWQLAIELGAFGVHLGQEDLKAADLNAIQTAGLALGISTHDKDELANIAHLKPSYIAFGPIFETQTKQTGFAAQGLERLAFWRQLVQCPLVAIGGINLENIESVYQTGVDGVAVISLLNQVENVKTLLQKSAIGIDTSRQKLETQ